MKSLFLAFTIFFYSLVSLAQTLPEQAKLISEGQIPAVVKDKNNRLHLAFGKGDSVLYTSSPDGKSFTPVSLVAIVPKVFSFAMRGPQIAVTTNGLIITVCTQQGDIFTFTKNGNGSWSKAIRINEKETAKEGLIALGSDGSKAFVVWLGIKNPEGQQLMGARSADSGKTWSKGMLVYDSPDSTICECCKPSVEMKGDKVFVMFRNQVNGTRDMYLIESADAGRSFRKAEKLGMGTCKLKGCPMDGGGITLNPVGVPQIIFRREDKLYGVNPHMPEKLLGQGRNGAVENINNKNVYAWTENGNIIIMKPGGQKLNLGKGSQPVLKQLTNEELLCVWEKDKKIYAALLPL